jgi:hypothetical protein
MPITVIGIATRGQTGTPEGRIRGTAALLWVAGITCRSMVVVTKLALVILDILSGRMWWLGRF